MKSFVAALSLLALPSAFAGSSDPIAKTIDLLSRSTAAIVENKIGANLVYGTISAESAAQSFIDRASATEALSVRRESEIRKSFEKLEFSGAVFATGASSVAGCGTTAPAILVLDIPRGSAYEIRFEGEGC